MSAFEIVVAGEADLEQLLPLMRAYCDFYKVDPSDEELLSLSRTLIADPEREGMQFLARDGNHRGAGFATLFWGWDTTEASRIGTMNDLYVEPGARGGGLAERLIQECLNRCEERGASRLEWITAPDNARAQAVYDRVGGVRQPWQVYQMRAGRR